MLRRQDLDPALGGGVQLTPVAAGWLLCPRAVDSDGVPGLHAVACRLDQRVGGRDDMSGGAVVGGQEGGLRPVVRLEAAEELDRGAIEGVDVLVVVTDREERELAVPVLQGPAGQRRYQLVLIRVDVLVLVHENPAKSRKKPLALLVRLLREQPLAPQQRHRLPHHLLERLAVGAFRPTAEARAGQPHGKAVAGEHRHSASIIANQVRKAAPDFYRRVPVVGQGQDPARVLAPGAHQVRNAMHEHPGLAGTGAGEHQHVGLLAVVGDDALLRGIAQALDDCPPRFGRGLAFDFLAPIRQPASKEVPLLQAEVVHGQMQGVGHGLKAAPRVLHHHVDLCHLPPVVELERLEVRGGKTTPGHVLLELDGHRGSEDGETLVQPDHFLLVQPQECTLQQLLGMLCPALQNQIGFERLQQPAEGGLGQQIRPAASGRQAGEQVLQQAMRAFAPARRGFLQRAPLTLQRHLGRLRVALAHPQAAAAPAFAAAVEGDAAQDAP